MDTFFMVLLLIKSQNFKLSEIQPDSNVLIWNFNILWSIVLYWVQPAACRQCVRANKRFPER